MTIAKLFDIIKYKREVSDIIAIGCEKIEKSFGVEKVLRDVTFTLNEGERLGIVGVNGAGKSTLINIISGKITDYNGNVFVAKNSKIGVLQQHTEFVANNTVFNEAISGFSDLFEMENKLERLHERMMSGDITASDEYTRLFERFTANGGLEYKSRTKSTLIGLGLGEDKFDLNCSDLSGGQKTILALTKLLLLNYDILILDEPTNHLDLNALAWLEKFISNYGKTILIISHDRYFLDKTTTKTLEILNGKGKIYNGNYSSFIKQRQKDNEITQKHYDNQQKEIARLRAYIEQQRRWNRERNIIAAESREKAIDRMKLVDAPEKEPEKTKLHFADAPECANDVLELIGLSKSFGDNKLFSNVSFLIKRKDRAFILGDNGTGKSTLLKILMGRITATGGEFVYGNRVVPAYYDQEYQELDPQNTVLDEIYYSADTDVSVTKIRTILGSFLFSGDDVFKKVADLSGGEKARLTFAKLVLKPSNLLILDEPTNHLDINTREVLEEALFEYEGTILAVSHDRYFINKLSTRILYLENNAIHDYKMDYEHFKESYDADSSSQVAQTESKQGRGKESYLSEKKRKSDLLKLRTRYEKLTKLIEENESRIAKINELLSSEEISSDYMKVQELSLEIDELTNANASYYEEWETLYGELEE